MTGKTKYADVCVRLTVKFEDDGEMDLMDQAHEEAVNQIEWPERYAADIEIIGKVRDTETPNG